MKIKGKDVDLEFNLDALELFCNKTGATLETLDTVLNDIKNVKIFIHCLIQDEKIALEDVGKIPFKELKEIFNLIKAETGNLSAP